MRITSSIFTHLMCFVMLIAGALYAQNGKITGYVFDSQYNEPLPGANMYIEGTSYGAAADINGKYTLVNVEPGEYQMVAKYIGYVEKVFNITVNPGETFEQLVILEFQSIEGEVIEVTAQAEGQMSAINQQLSSNTISNVVSEARIQELPDVNAAESIGRLPGVAILRSGGEANKVIIRGLSPKYSTVTVNGVRVPATGGDDRSVDLSLISSNMLDGIEVKKANTPDMDADVIGGAVDLRLKSAPEGLHYDVMAQGGYSKLQEYYGNYKLSGSISDRFYNGLLGIIGTVTLDNYDRSADKLSGGYVVRDSDFGDRLVTRVNNANFREENLTRARSGGSIVLDYKLSNGTITANTFYNQLTSESLFRISNLSTGNQGSQNQRVNMEDRSGTTSIYTGGVGIEQDFDWISYDASVSFGGSKTDQPHNYRWQFTREEAWSTQTIGENFHISDLQGLIKPEAQFVRSIILESIWEDKVEREENTQSVQFNVKYPFKLSNQINGYLKTGAKFRWLDRLNDQTQNGRAGLQYGSNSASVSDIFEAIIANLDTTGYWSDLESIIRAHGGLPVDSIASDYSRDDFLDGDYELGITPQRARMMELTRAMRASDGDPDNDAWRNNSIGSRGQDYDGEERYRAGYLMAEIKLGGYFTFIPGFRYEYDYSKYNGQRFREVISGWQDLEPVGLDTLTNVRENEFFLPMLHLNSQPLDWLKIRLARTETLTRPDYLQYAPISSIDGFQSWINAANGMLKPAHSTNYDFSVSVYDNYIGLFSIGGFYKSIEDLIIRVNYSTNPYMLAEDIPLLKGTNVPNEWFDNSPTLATYINNPYEAEYRGFEIDWQTYFWYLPSFLSGLVLNANYTYIDSEMKYQGYYLYQTDSIRSQIRPGIYNYYYGLITDSTRTGRMPDQPKHIFNLTLGYDYKDFSVRLSYLFRTDISRYIDLSQPLFDNFSDDYYRWDLSLKQKLPYNIELVANISNLNERPDRNLVSKATNVKNPTYVEYYGLTADIGLRYRF